ncbi:hypothetical protein CPB86DRAFT_792296 [Serendipita vermifera]|nr:hypothetical protein CPB86DRAFT_792296 [Serendipita vermifera]
MNNSPQDPFSNDMDYKMYAPSPDADGHGETQVHECIPTAGINPVYKEIQTYGIYAPQLCYSYILALPQSQVTQVILPIVQQGAPLARPHGEYGVFNTHFTNHNQSLVTAPMPYQAPVSAPPFMPSTWVASPMDLSSLQEQNVGYHQPSLDPSISNGAYGNIPGYNVNHGFSSTTPYASDVLSPQSIEPEAGRKILCPDCGTPSTKQNIARHKRSGACMRARM